VTPQVIARVGLAIGMMVGAWAGLEGRAAAQAVFVTSPSGGGPTMVAGPRLGPGPMARLDAGPPVNSAELKAYSELLGLTPEQLEDATGMLEAMQAEFGQVQADRQSAMEAVRKEYEQSKDMQVLLRDAPAIMQTFRDKRSALERGFFDDLRLTLTPEQDDRWGAMERLRRRERTLSPGMLSGESVDLIKVLREMELPESVHADVRELLAGYEAELDRALIERNQIRERHQDMIQIGAAPPDLGKMQELTTKSREASAKVRDVNRRHARLIRGMLPDDMAATFDARMNALAMPDVFGPSRVTRLMDAAGGLDDLTAEQRRALQDLREAYRRESASANEAWARAIEEDEMNPSGGSFFFGGGSIRIATDDGTGNPTESARAKAAGVRRDLDARFRDRAESILTPEQREKSSLRVGEQEAEEGLPAGDAMVVEVHRSSDGVNEPQEAVNVRMVRPVPAGGSPAAPGG